MNDLLFDIRHGLRVMRRAPAFSLLAVAILALGIGANTAIFSIIHGVLLNPLPYRDPANVVVLWTDLTRTGGVARLSSSPQDFLDWRERAKSFSGMAAYRNDSLTFTAFEQPVTPLTHSVTADYFEVLGVQAYRGRTFREGEDRNGGARVAVISHALWQNSFGGGESIIGQAIELDNVRYDLVGVLPPGFHSPNLITVQPDLWVPIDRDALSRERLPRTIGILARLRPGVDVNDARAEMAVLARRTAEEHPETSRDAGINVVPLRDDLVGNFRPVLTMLLAAVVLVLLIACANIANLLLSRGQARAREMAVRSAIGASRARIAQQVLTESVLLAAAGAGLGVLLAVWAVPPLLALVPDSAGLPFAQDARVDGAVLGFTVALSILSGLLFGLLPARQQARGHLVEHLKEGGRSGTAGRHTAGFRSLLVAGEVALSLMLLAGAGLMLQSFWKLSQVRNGFDAANLLTIRNSLRGQEFMTPASRRGHFAKAVEKLRELPEVESVGAVSFAPPVTAFAFARFTRSDQAPVPGKEPGAVLLYATPGYFETLRAPLAAGRFFDAHDDEKAAQVALVSKKLADRFFPGEEAVGKSISVSAGGGVRLTGQWTIVGVVGDQRGPGLNPEPLPILYVPHAQAPVAIMNFVLRTRGEPMAVAGAAQKAIWSLGRTMNVYGVATMEQRMAESYWQTRFTMILLGLFAGVGLLLATMGIYAVVSYTVAQRTQEIGIRMALGGRRAHVVGSVMREALVLAAIGVAVGVAASLALTRLLAGLLYGVAPGDPWILGAGSIVLLAFAALSSLPPALRASGVDPAAVLRNS